MVNVIEKGFRKCVITKIVNKDIKANYKLEFYFDGFPDYEWKRGCQGLPTCFTSTYIQALAKANYYVSKSN